MEPRIQGFLVISGTRIIVPTELSTIDTSVVLPSIGTIGTILGGNLSATIVGTIPVNVVGGNIEVGTVMAVVDLGTIGTILSTVNVTGQVNVGSITGGVINSIGTIVSGQISVTNFPTSLNSVGTVGTIASPVSVTGQVNVGSITGGVINTIGSIASPVSVNGTVTSQEQFKMTDILSYPFGSIFGGAVTSTLIAGSLQSLVVDIVYGTVLAGSIQTSVLGVEPQSGIITGTIVSGNWYSGTVVAAQRLVAAPPLGYEVAVQVFSTGSISGVFVTAEQST